MLLTWGTPIQIYPPTLSTSSLTSLISPLCRSQAFY
jgi:hypothetical protein